MNVAHEDSAAQVRICGKCDALLFVAEKRPKGSLLSIWCLVCSARVLPTSFSGVTGNAGGRLVQMGACFDACRFTCSHVPPLYANTVVVLLHILEDGGLSVAPLTV